MSFAKFALVFQICVLFVACSGLDNKIASPHKNKVSQATKNVMKRSGNESPAGWTNINQELDMALQMIVPMLAQQNYTHFELPKIKETLSLFVSDYLLRVMGLYVSGKAGGSARNIILSGDYTIGLQDANIRLNRFKVLSYDNMKIQLNQNPILDQLSVPILTPITEIFKSRIISIVSGAVRSKLDKLIDDINKNDRLHFKEFLRMALAGLIGKTN